MNVKPSLLLLMALASTATGLAHAVSAAQVEKPAAAEPATPSTRLGASLDREMARRDQADSERTRQLQMREQVVRAAEQRLGSNLKEEQQQERKTRSSVNGDDRDEYDQLARIFQSMKPSKAATVFEELSLDVQLQVARRMRERQTGQIMADMAPAAAARLSMALAGSPPLMALPSQSASKR